MLKLQLKVTWLVVWEEGKHFMIKEEILFLCIYVLSTRFGPQQERFAQRGRAD